MSINNNHSKDSDISIEEVARWMAVMASTDGVVSSSELKVLKDFAEKFNIDPEPLVQMANENANQVAIPEVLSVTRNEMKGLLFEKFVGRLTSDKTIFKRLEWRGDKSVDGLYSLDCLMPDFHLEHLLGTQSVRYFVECKYRTAPVNGIIDLTAQLGRYRRMASMRYNEDLFLAIGVGGVPSAPEKLYVIPSRMIKRDAIIRLQNFEKCICDHTSEAFHKYISRCYQRWESKE